MNKTAIEWTGYTWNPITGCKGGCTYCYARKMAENPFYHKAFPYGFEPHLYIDRMDEPLKLKTPSKIFVCSMSDLFGIGVPEQWTNLVLLTIMNNPQHTFQLLTKQPQNLAKFSPFPQNAWVGVSVTDEGQYLLAYHALPKVQATVKFLSFEPLLKPILVGAESLQHMGINWLIIGAQTPYSPKTAPKLGWVRGIVEATYDANIPYFLKGNLLPVIEGNSRILFWNTVNPDPARRLRQEFPNT